MNLYYSAFTCISFFCILLLSCTSTQESIEVNCHLNKPIEEFKNIESLGIISPDDFGGTIRSSYIFQDTLMYLLADKPKFEVKIIDLKNKNFVGGVPIDPNFINFPSGIQVISKDSILISDFHFPTLLLMTSHGKILDTYNLYKEDLWKMPKEGFANFGLYGGFGIDFKYLPERNSILIPLRQLDQWYFVKEKKNFPAIGEYSLDSKNFTSLFGKYEGMYASEENFLLPFYLSHPIIEQVGNQIILSYSLDPNLYVYSLDGEFLFKKCGSISEFELGQPLRYDMNDYDSEGLKNYNRNNSYFGDFFYIKGSDRFVRMFWKCEKSPNNECKSKKAYTLIFDQNLDLLEVKKVNNIFDGNDFMYQQPYRKGFLSKLATRESDDQFILNLYYQLD